MHKFKFTNDMSKEEFNDQCKRAGFWYHSFYFDNGFEVRGDYNVGLTVEDYGFPEDMTGMNVLDIGKASGWFSFYFEQKGANVTVVDVDGYDDFDVYGNYLYSDRPPEPRPSPKKLPESDPTSSNAFWIMHKILGSKIKYFNSRIYDVSPKLFGGKKFDLVFVGSLLIHLRDPIGALRAARSVCKDRLIATTTVHVDDNPHPFMELPYTDFDKISWWLPNKSCYRHWFKAAGFGDVNIDNTVQLFSDKEMIHDTNKHVRNSSHLLHIGDATI